MEEQQKQTGGIGRVAMGVVAGMAAGMAATYAISGDAVLLRRNLRKVERCTTHAMRTLEKYLR